MNAFERQVVGQIHTFVGPSRPVDDAAIFNAITTTQSPKWRFQSMFSATKFVVAGTVVALFGGFLLAGLLTQPSERGGPGVEASASASAVATPAPSVVPGTELDLEQVAPGVFRVLADGLRRLMAGVRQVVVTPNGDVWVEMGDDKNSRVVRLGDRGVSLKLTGKQRGTLGMTAGGAPVVMGADAAWRFDGEAWRKTELSEYDACWVAWSAIEQLPAVGADGACYTSHGDDDEHVVRIDADGTRTAFTRAELGLGPKPNWANRPVAGPDGTIWAAVFDTDFRTGIFRGLVRYDGSAWSFIPYDGDDVELCGSCFTSLAVGRDGIVWFGRRGVDDAAPVLSWDGESWGSYLQGEGLSSTTLHVDRAWPNGDVWFGSEARWDGTTVSLAEPPIPWGKAWYSATAPDGSAWTVIDKQLYIVTPEAVME